MRLCGDCGSIIEGDNWEDGLCVRCSNAKPVALFGPDYFDVEPDELIEIGNAGKEAIRYVRSDLVQRQIEEAVKQEREKEAFLQVPEGAL